MTDHNADIEIRDQCATLIASGKVPESVIREKFSTFAEPSEITSCESASFVVGDDRIPHDVMREIVEEFGEPSELTDAGRAHIANMEAESDEERDETERHEEIEKQAALGYDETDAEERARIICDAKGINAQAVETDHSGPGKFEGIAEKDRQFAAALLVIANNGDADHDYEDGSHRIGWHIVGEDSNGFVWYGTEDRDEADEHEKRDSREELTQSEAESRFEEVLNETGETVNIGTLEYEPGEVLRKIDPIAFRQGMLDWADSEDIEIV